MTEPCSKKDCFDCAQNELYGTTSINFRDIQITATTATTEQIWNDYIKALAKGDVIMAEVSNKSIKLEKCYWCETPRSYTEPCKQCGRP